MPGFKIRAHRTLALAALIHRDRGIVHHFQKRHHPLRFAIGALDAAAERTNREVVALLMKAPRFLMKKSVNHFTLIIVVAGLINNETY